MPFTPFHLGPPLLLGVILYKWLDLPALLVGSVIIDVRAALVVYGPLKPPIHGILTTFIGGTIIASLLAAAFSVLPSSIEDLLARLRLTENTSPRAILAGSLVGVYSHVMHSYGHYYNPSLLGGTGGAPSNAKEYFNKAQDAEDSGNTSNAREKAGWACHFIVDVGQPLHTGAEASQAANSSVHYDYEGWVNSNWDSEENFSDEFDNNTYYPINSPSQAVKDLADVSHDYVGTIFDTINNNPDSWKDDDDVIDATENVLVKTGYYNKGFLQEIF